MLTAFSENNLTSMTPIAILTVYFTAGLPDIAMSALVQEQIEGITPKAISMISPQKFAVSCHYESIFKDGIVWKLVNNP